ncbi:F-box/LRR-repeat protein 13-like [Neltuma alba]|uniref:F-box/LRR-repeat protein 13-like n=1 Tax=Neltuma alba TaxID=207710 RepID=UPI0010A57CE0|nr:F-box/LRR-repeat protein 13-like [Prosopis alba]
MAKSKSQVAGDRISNLPDSLLQHILSLLNTKEAISTSILSKRWTSLWIGLPTLDLDAKSFCHRRFGSFERFVDKVLISNNDSTTIKLLRLNCVDYYYLDDRKIDGWFKAAINRKVEQIELSVPYLFQISVPSNIFVCSAIRVLKLHGVRIDTPLLVNLPSLKVLHLERVRFEDYKCVVKIFSGCANVEELVLKHIVVHDLEFTNYRLLGSLLRPNVPSFLGTLKKFLVDFKGKESEFKVAMFILNNARD